MVIVLEISFVKWEACLWNKWSWRLDPEREELSLYFAKSVLSMCVCEFMHWIGLGMIPGHKEAYDFLPVQIYSLVVEIKYTCKTTWK